MLLGFGFPLNQAKVKLVAGDLRAAQFSGYPVDTLLKHIEVFTMENQEVFSPTNSLKQAGIVGMG